MSHMMRSFAAIVVSLTVLATLATVTVTDVRAQVAQPEYGAGPGVAAGAPLATNPSGPSGSGTVQAVAPSVRPGGPGVQQAAPVAAATLPRTGGELRVASSPWSVAGLGIMLIGLLGAVGATRARAGRAA